MNFPAELKYTKDHEWVRVEGEEAVIGITDFAQRELGDIVFVDVNGIGDEIEQNEVFGSIEAVKTVSDLFMPVTSTLLELNGDIDSSPELINQDPYGKGWIIRVKLSDQTQINELLSAEDYKDLVSA